MVLLIIDI